MGLSASVSFFPLPLPPLSFFGSRLISRAIKELTFHGLVLLRNQTETLATQAILDRSLECLEVSIRQIWSYVNVKHAKAYLRRCTSYKGLCRLRRALPIIRLILSHTLYNLSSGQQGYS